MLVTVIKCKYCGKEVSKYGIKNHERCCKLNPNRIPGKSNWWLHPETHKNSNQFIKAKEENRKIKVSDKTRYKLGNSWRGKTLTNETKEKIKNTIKKNIENNNWHLSFSKSRTFEYKGIKFQGLWEVKFAKYLDNKNVKWERPHKTYKYIFENENHRYLPDFYLPEYNLYIEIKGYPTKRDFSKWEQFTDNLDIYFGDDLYNLGIIDSYKDRYKSVDKKFRIKHIEI